MNIYPIVENFFRNGKIFRVKISFRVREFSGQKILLGLKTLRVKVFFRVRKFFRVKIFFSFKIFFRVKIFFSFKIFFWVLKFLGFKNFLGLDTFRVRNSIVEKP